jgi:hypothetical protein
VVTLVLQTTRRKFIKTQIKTFKVISASRFSRFLLPNLMAATASLSLS